MVASSFSNEARPEAPTYLQERLSSRWICWPFTTLIRPSWSVLWAGCSSQRMQTPLQSWPRGMAWPPSLWTGGSPALGPCRVDGRVACHAAKQHTHSSRPAGSRCRSPFLASSCEQPLSADDKCILSKPQHMRKLARCRSYVYIIQCSDCALLHAQAEEAAVRRQFEALDSQAAALQQQQMQLQEDIDAHLALPVRPASQTSKSSTLPTSCLWHLLMHADLADAGAYR